jgi:hypothetical protein
MVTIHQVHLKLVSLLSDWLHRAAGDAGLSQVAFSSHENGHRIVRICSVTISDCVRFTVPISGQCFRRVSFQRRLISYNLCGNQCDIRDFGAGPIVHERTLTSYCAESKLQN